MKLPTIEMKQEEAKEAFDNYRESLRRHHDDEFAQITKGYKELARGHRLIRLTEAIQLGGTMPQNVPSHGLCATPRLAICKADEKFCTFEVREEGSVTFMGFKPHERNGWNNRGDHRAPTRRVALPAGTLTGDGIKWIPEGSMEVVVPIVPPPLLPKAKLSGFHILWEVEEWKPPLRPRVPRDPALLKRIGGDLFAVLAVWDLTELERAVLSGRVNG